MNKKKIAVILSILFLTTVTLTCKDDSSGDLLSLPPMKNQFAEHFMIGNIYWGALSRWDWLDHHYNVITAENIMKPGYLAPAKGSYSFDMADNFVNEARARGFKVVGHTLLWHSQNASWMTKANCDLDTLRNYVTSIVKHFEGRIYSWDVLNEAFPDNASSGANWKDAIRKGTNSEGQGANPWYAAIGSDFVYEGFLAARLADPNAVLYYNDYNTDNPNRARLIRDMVKDVNDKYLALPADQKPAGEPADRLLIEGIGMQEHHNTTVSASAIKRTIDLFRPLGVILSVSELDVLAQPWNNSLSNPGPNKPPAEGNDLLRQAQLYGEYFKVYIDNSDIIERVSFWGVTDNLSWRSPGQPLLFDDNGKAKPAYYSVVNTLK